MSICEFGHQMAKKTDSKRFKINSCSMKKFLRLQVEHQGGVLQAYWVAADCVVDRVAGGEGWSTPVQKYSG